MNFVVFSWNFPPMNDAEAYCTARFASSLAMKGNSVHVVTMDHPGEMTREVYDFLVDCRIRVTRVPLTTCAKAPLLTRIRYLTPEWGSIDFRRAIRVLRKVLSAYECPVLVSRANPSSSHIIAWYCRRLADKWVAHFSDPFPLPAGGRSFAIKMRYFLGRVWGRRVVQDADGLSITCDGARQYFASLYGEELIAKKMFVTTHIGEPELPMVPVEYKGDDSCPLIVHAGQLYRNRGAADLIQAVEDLNRSGFRCQFKQVGVVARDVLELFNRSNNCEVITDLTPGLATAMAKSAAACFVPDLQMNLPYSPFLPSKFAYQVFTDTPLVLYSFKESTLFQYANRFQDAGLYFADRVEIGSLARALRDAILTRKDSLNRTLLREEFSRSKVATFFVDNCARLR